MNKLIKIAILCLAIGVMSGCATVDPPQRKPQLQTGQVKGQAHIHTELAKQVEDVARSVHGVNESTALVMNNQVAVAVKVSGFDRLHLKSIRQELHTQVNGIAPEYDIHVTADKKLYAQLQMLKEQIKTLQGDIPARFKDDYNGIMEDMKG